MKQKTLSKTFTACYSRLSREDEKQGESNSISNQKKKLERYAEEHGLPNIVHYVDDGYSGANFDRPAWKRMITDVEQGRVKTILTKDLSRIGRNYLGVGMFTELIFQRYQVRFVAIDDGVDSCNQESSEFSPILNLVNQFYVKEFSQRLKAAWQAKRIAGLHTATKCLYGYQKDPSNPDKWIVDEPVANVVRRIFALALEGRKINEIATLLFEEHIETPAYHRAKTSPDCALPDQPYNWSETTIRRLLTAQEYTGCTVNHKIERPDYCNRALRVSIEPSQWQVIEGTQEPIISREQFEQVQERFADKRILEPIEQTNPLKGVVYCADCGAVMLNTKVRPYPLKDRNGEVTGKMSNFKDFFTCTTYKNSQRHHRKQCSRHFVNTESLTLVILETLKQLSALALHDEATLLGLLNQNQQSHDLPDAKKFLSHKQSRFDQLDELILNAYESNFKDALSDEQLATLVSEYEAEQEQLAQDISALQSQLDGQAVSRQDTTRFVKRLHAVTAFDQLTPMVVSELIDKVVVHERVGKRNHFTQEIELYFRFVGKVELTKGGDSR